MIYDTIIIGSGPAGLTAAIYARRAELNAIVIEQAPMSGGQVVNTSEVDNYPGMPNIGGFDLSIKFREHSENLGTEFINGKVISVDLEDDIKMVTLENGDKYKTKTIIISTGGDPRHLDVPGEDKLAGMGISYCATCDGAFFRNKNVVVVGGGDTAVEDAIFLARLAKKVYVIHRRDEFRASASNSSKIAKIENVEILWDSVTVSINGDEVVESLTLKNVKTEEESTIDVDGVFIAVGHIPNTEPFKDLVDLDEGGFIIADETTVTSRPGVFAAGDLRTKELRQIVTATADGASAITSVERYLNSLAE